MKELEKLGRRDFTLKSAMALLSGVAITLTSCGDDAPTTPSPAPSPEPEPSGVEGVVGSNHGHEAFISGARIAEGGDLSLDITGNADHPHTVEITAAELQQIGDGVRVMKISSTDVAHSHSVTFN